MVEQAQRFRMVPGLVTTWALNCVHHLPDRRLIVPCTMSDYAATVATLSLDEVLAMME